jgi:SAM-dependent methyltransferase
VPEHALGRVLQTLAALGLLGREGDRFCLPPGLAALYRSARRVGATARPIGDAAMFWGHLPHWAATGTPCTEMDRPDGAVYAQQVGRLGASFGEAARELAALLRAGGRVPAGASILDIGAGSGVWSLALAATDAAAAVTALDREPVLEITRVYAAAAGLAERLRTIAGDWRDAPLPDGAFDLVVLANLCHLEPGPAVLALLRRAYAALRPGGTVVVVDMIPERDAAADLGTLLEGLHLGLRTPDGGVHDREQYRAWLKEAGFIPGQALPLPTTRGARAVQLGHRRCPADCVHRRGGAGW